MCSSQRRRAQSTSKIVEKMKKRLAEQVTGGIKIVIYRWQHIYPLAGTLKITLRLL